LDRRAVVLTMTTNMTMDTTIIPVRRSTAMRGHRSIHIVPHRLPGRRLRFPQDRAEAAGAIKGVTGIRDSGQRFPQDTTQ
jgi:hypothetical protein